jgi:hypothetical protein
MLEHQTLRNYEGGRRTLIMNECQNSVSRRGIALVLLKEMDAYFAELRMYEDIYLPVQYFGMNAFLYLKKKDGSAVAPKPLAGRMGSA